MVIFYSYVSLPEGTMTCIMHGGLLPSNEHIIEVKAGLKKVPCLITRVYETTTMVLQNIKHMNL